MASVNITVKKIDALDKEVLLTRNWASQMEGRISEQVELLEYYRKEIRINYSKSSKNFSENNSNNFQNTVATKQNKTVEEVSLIITDRVDKDNDTTHIEASRNGRINVRKLNGKLHNIIGKAQENNIFVVLIRFTLASVIQTRQLTVYDHILNEMLVIKIF